MEKFVSHFEVLANFEEGISSNINEVIKAVLNLLLFFLRKDFTHTKSTKTEISE